MKTNLRKRRRYVLFRERCTKVESRGGFSLLSVCYPVRSRQLAVLLEADYRAEAFNFAIFEETGHSTFNRLYQYMHMMY
jgi:hypothetical protein